MPCCLSGANVRGLAWEHGSDERIVFSDMDLLGGIFRASLTSAALIRLTSNSAAPFGLSQPFGLFSDEEGIVFSDLATRTICRLNPDSTVSTVCGSEDGSFSQPTGICHEKSTIFVADTGNASLRLVITRTESLALFLQRLNRLLKLFGVHLPGVNAERHQLSEALTFIDDFVTEIRQWTAEANTMRGASPTANAQGPEGAVPTKTIRSLEIVAVAIRSIIGVLDRVNPALKEKVVLSSLLTLAVEHFFSVMRSRTATPTMLEYGYFHGTAVKEMVRKLVQGHSKIYTGSKSPYGHLDLSFPFSALTFPTKQPGAHLNKMQLQNLRDFASGGKALQQLTVRQHSTKYKPGTLPALAYRTEQPEEQLQDFRNELSLQLQVPQFEPGKWLALNPGEGINTTAGFVLALITRVEATSSNVSVDLFDSDLIQPCAFMRIAQIDVSQDCAFVGLDSNAISHSAVDEDVFLLDCDVYSAILRRQNGVDDHIGTNIDSRSLEQKVEDATLRPRKANKRRSSRKGRFRKPPQGDSGKDEKAASTPISIDNVQQQRRLRKGRGQGTAAILRSVSMGEDDLDDSDYHEEDEDED